MRAAIILVGFLLSTQISVAEILDAKGSVESVTLYRGQALVTRVVPIDAPAGAVQLTVSGLPDAVIVRHLQPTLPADLAQSGSGEQSGNNPSALRVIGRQMRCGRAGDQPLPSIVVGTPQPTRKGPLLDVADEFGMEFAVDPISTGFLFREGPRCGFRRKVARRFGDRLPLNPDHGCQ